MIHVAQKPDLAQSPLRIDLVIKCIRDLLDRHLLASLRIQSRAAEDQYLRSRNAKSQDRNIQAFSRKKGTGEEGITIYYHTIP